MLSFDVEKRYGSFHLAIQAEVDAEWLVLLAPSGAGKSLTLNLISGIDRPERGHVRLDGRTLFDAAQGIDLPMRTRRVGYLFQDYALFPHLSVAANVAYGLPRSRARESAVADWLERFGLAGRGRDHPHQLSGGQRQRVALARTLAAEPAALLLDEPFSALDRRIREALQEEMLALKARLNLPVILVTHDFAEAQLLGDRVAVLEHGRVLEVGEKARVFARPRRHETARFLGTDNVLEATVRGVEPGGLLGVDVEGLHLAVPNEERFAPGARAWLCVYGPDVRLQVVPGTRPNAFPGVVRDVQEARGMHRVLVVPDAAPHLTLTMVLDDYVLQRYGVRPGLAVRCWLPPDKVMLAE